MSNKGIRISIIGGSSTIGQLLVHSLLESRDLTDPDYRVTIGELTSICFHNANHELNNENHGYIFKEIYINPDTTLFYLQKAKPDILVVPSDSLIGSDIQRIKCFLDLIDYSTENSVKLILIGGSNYNPKSRLIYNIAQPYIEYSVQVRSLIVTTLPLNGVLWGSAFGISIDGIIEQLTLNKSNIFNDKTIPEIKFFHDNLMSFIHIKDFLRGFLKVIDHEYYGCIVDFDTGIQISLENILLRLGYKSHSTLSTTTSFTGYLSDDNRNERTELLWNVLKWRQTKTIEGLLK